MYGVEGVENGGGFGGDVVGYGLVVFLMRVVIWLVWLKMFVVLPLLLLCK